MERGELQQVEQLLAADTTGLAAARGAMKREEDDLCAQGRVQAGAARGAMGTT